MPDMSRAFKYLVALCVSFFAFCLVCGAQAVDYNGFEASKFSLKKNYEMPGKTVRDLYRLVNYWDLESIGLEFDGVAGNGIYGKGYCLSLFDVPIDGTEVNIVGRLVFFFRDGGFDVAFRHVSAGWRHKSIIFLPAPGETDGYIRNMSRRNKRTLSCIYAKAEEIFAELCEYIDVKVEESKNVTLKDFGMVPVE